MININTPNVSGWNLVVVMGLLIFLQVESALPAPMDEREAIFKKLNTMNIPGSGQMQLVWIPAASDIEETSKMVIGALQSAVSSKTAVAIVGPDGAHNLEIVKQASSECPFDALRGVTVVYLGKKADEEKLFTLRDMCGATIKFGIYP